MASRIVERLRRRKCPRFRHKHGRRKFCSKGKAKPNSCLPTSIHPPRTSVQSPWRDAVETRGGGGCRSWRAGLAAATDAAFKQKANQCDNRETNEQIW